MVTPSQVLDPGSVLKEIFEISTTLSEEAQVAAIAKCKEMKLDPNRGEITLDETLINLSSARDVLVDAITNRKLVQLPISIQKAFLSSLRDASKALAGLAGGSDEVVNLVN